MLYFHFISFGSADVMSDMATRFFGKSDRVDLKGRSPGLNGVSVTADGDMF